MSEQSKLSMEQLLSLRAYELKVANYSDEQARFELVEMYKAMMFRHEEFKHEVQVKWGILPPTL